MNLQIGLVRGRSAVSSVIQWFTRSVYSHALVSFNEGPLSCVYEAVPQGLVKSPSLSTWNAGAEIDLLEYNRELFPDEIQRGRDFAENCIGAKYDYRMLLGFVDRLDWEPPGSRTRLFCSEFVMLVSIALRRDQSRALLARVPPWKVNPDHLNLSPLLKWVGTIKA